MVVYLLDNYEEPNEVVRNINWTEEEYEAKKQERLNKIEEECFNLAKEKGYFTEDFNVSDVLNYRQVYIIGVDAIERYIGRELGARDW